MNKIKAPQNYYILPLIIALVQFCFLSVALFGSRFNIENKVLIVSFLFVCLWGILFFADIVRKKNFTINISNILLIILFFLLCLNIIRQSWFVNYLRIDAIQRFFEGKTFIDTLYHSAICESIVTNGYPSIQQNAPFFLSYHCLSHYLIAGISQLLIIPCFVAYNYLFPIIFIPLFLYLLQKVALIGKSYFSGINELSFIDYIILAGACCGFVTKQQQLNLGCNFNVNIYNSESCLLAIILLLLYFCLINKGYRNIRSFDNINLFVLIPIYILILSYTKISFGVIFALGASYYVFRKYLFNDKKWFLFVGYCGVFVIYYIFIRKIAPSYSGSAATAQNDFILFHYVRTKCRNLFYIFLHYGVLFLPIIATILLRTPEILKDILKYKKENVFVEMIFLLMVGACLPGIFMNIHGGSAFYFVIPVYICSWILLISYNVPAALIQKHVRIGQLWFTLLTVMIVLTCARNMKAYNSVSQTLKARMTSAQIAKDKEYLAFNQIRKEIVENRKDFCVFLSDDSDMISRFDSALKETSPKIYYCRPYLAVSAYLGVPVINSIYEKDGYFYRGDDKEYGGYGEFKAYSMPPAVCGEKVTEENMIEKAKAINKKRIILINRNNYSVITVR